MFTLTKFWYYLRHRWLFAVTVVTGRSHNITWYVPRRLLFRNSTTPMVEGSINGEVDETRQDRIMRCSGYLSRWLPRGTGGTHDTSVNIVGISVEIRNSHLSKYESLPLPAHKRSMLYWWRIRLWNLVCDSTEGLDCVGTTPNYTLGATNISNCIIILCINRFRVLRFKSGSACSGL